MIIPLRDVEAIEVDALRLADDYIKQQSGVLPGLEAMVLNDFARWLFDQLNAKIAAANAAGLKVAR